MFCKKSVLRNLAKLIRVSQQNTCDRASFLIKLLAEACNFTKKDSDTGVFL